MSRSSASITFSSPEATARFARIVGAELKPGDTLLLNGPVGAGKTHFARHLIQSLLVTPEDVPSPTFTLIQSYETNAGVLWHADLYRVTSVFEVEELGLIEAFDTAICIVEWPDRLGALEPADALSFWLTDGPSDDARDLSLTWSDDRWTKLVEKWITQ